MRESFTGDSVRELFFGPHRFCWEPPDLGHVVYSGYVDADMVQSFAAQARPFLLAQPLLFMLVDVTALTKISAEGRKMSAESSKGLQLRGVAIVGSSPSLRVVAGLVSRAVEILSGNTENPTRFFDRETEARDWIAHRRMTIHGQTRH